MANLRSRIAPAVVAGWLLAACHADRPVTPEVDASGAPAFAAAAQTTDQGRADDGPEEITAAAADAAAPPVAPSPALVDSLNRFAFDLFPKVVQPGKDAAVSPPSVAFAMAMVLAGARGPTRAQIARTLHVDGVEDVPDAFAALIAGLNVQEDDDEALHVADRLWGQEGFPFSASFLSLLSAAYHAPFGTVDFGVPSAACAEVNAWASEQTRGRITEILNTEAIDGSTRLVIANAVYLRARWQQPFEPRATREEDFFTVSGRARVDMMHALQTVPYATFPGGKLVDIPYRKGLSMVVVLPDSVTGIADIERRTAREFTAWRRALRARQVDLRIPRWTSDSPMLLRPALESLGMPLPFDGQRADLSGMTDTNRSLCVADILHRTFVQTDERGTEAAAVTSVIVVQRAKHREPPPVSFYANHPFLYFVVERSTGLILFAGQVAHST
jgi:serpin B